MKDYYLKLRGRIFKVLPLFETNKKAFLDHTTMLVNELAGADSEPLIRIKMNLNHLIKESNTIKNREVKKTVFDCIGIVNYQLKDYEDIE